MSATEELRRMLDERGVEHIDFGGMTEWTDGGGRMCRAYTRNEPTCVDIAMLAVTPEQAIAATLGGGECEFVIEDNMNETEGMGDVWFRCTNCDTSFDYYADDWLMEQNYCPHCGARIRKAVKR